MNDDGTINIETLQSSIAVNENIVYSAQNETFKQDDTGITLTDANNPNDKTKINSKGIFISTDGGTTWKNAVRGEGISTQYLTAGNINVGSIVILDGQFTTFRWDSKGISAYVPIEGGGINLGKFIRFDHYGIYGVNGDSKFSPNSEQDIYDNANFGMTWNRFFMKNNKGTGSIEISTDKDIQIKAGENERIKIGRLDENGQQYGIRISDDSGKSVMETGDEGKLWLKNQLNISKSNNTYNIQLGFLDKTKDNSDIHEVFNATDKFIVYEDGSMKATEGEFTGTIHATDGEFTGTINATGGKIGNMTIGTVEETISDVQKLDIISNLGYTFKVEERGIAPILISLEVNPIGFTIIDPDKNIVWSGSTDYENWRILGYGAKLDMSYENFNNLQKNDVYYIKVNYSYNEIQKNSYTTLYKVSNGQDARNVEIETSNGKMFINNNITTTLTARVWKGGEEITSKLPYTAFSWTKTNDDGEIDAIWTEAHQNFGNVVTITSDDILRRAQFSCTVNE